MHIERCPQLRALAASIAIFIVLPLMNETFAAPQKAIVVKSVRNRCVARYRSLRQPKRRRKIAHCIRRAAKRQGSSSGAPLSGAQPEIPLAVVQAASIPNSLWLETAGVRQYRLIESTAEYPSGASPPPSACAYTDADKYLCQVPAPTGACANGSKVRGAVTDIRSDDPHDLVGWYACTLPSTATSTQSTCTLSKPAYTTSQFLNSNCATGAYWGHPDTGFTARGLLNRGDFYVPSIYYPRNLIPYNITHSDGETRVAGAFTYYHTALEAKGFGMTASRDTGSLQSTNLVIDDSVDNGDLRVCEKDVAAFAQRKESGVWKIFGFGDNNNPGDPGSGSPYRCDGTYVTGDIPPNWPNRKSGSAAPGSTMSFTPSSLTIDHSGVQTTVAINEAVSAPDAETIVYNSYNPFNDIAAGTGAFLPRAFVVRTSPSQVVQLAPLDGTAESRDFSYAEAMAVRGNLRYAAGWAGEWCYDKDPATNLNCNERVHAVVWDAGTGGIEKDLHPAGYQYSFARDISISSSGEIAVVVTGVKNWGNSRGATNEFLCGPGTGKTCETRDAFIWRKSDGSWTSELLYRWDNGTCQGKFCTGYNYTSDMTLREAFAVAHDSSGALYIGGYGSASDTAGALCSATTSGRGEIRRACEYFGIRGLYAHIPKDTEATATPTATATSTATATATATPTSTATPTPTSTPTTPAIDECPSDAKFAPGLCGCGVTDPPGATDPAACPAQAIYSGDKDTSTSGWGTYAILKSFKGSLYAATEYGTYDRYARVTPQLWRFNADNTHVRLAPQLCGGSEGGSLNDMEVVKDSGGNDDALVLLVQCSEKSYLLRFRTDSDWSIVKPGMRFTNSYGTYLCNAEDIAVLGSDAYLYCQEEHIWSVRKIPLTTLLNGNESTIQTVLNTDANRFWLSGESAPIGAYVSSSAGESSTLFAGPLWVADSPIDPWNPSGYIKPFRLKPGDAAFEAGPSLRPEPFTRQQGGIAMKQHGSSMLFGLSVEGEIPSIYRLNSPGSASPAWDPSPIVAIASEPYDPAQPMAWRGSGVSKHSMLTSSDGKFYVTRSAGKATVHVFDPGLHTEIATTPELGEWPSFPATASTTNLAEHGGSIYLSVPGRAYDPSSAIAVPNPGFKIYRLAPRPGLTLRVSPNRSFVTAQNPPVFELRVANSGPFPLDHIVLESAAADLSRCISFTALSGGTGTLSPGGEWTYQCQANTINADTDLHFQATAQYHAASVSSNVYTVATKFMSETYSGEKDPATRGWGTYAILKSFKESLYAATEYGTYNRYPRVTPQLWRYNNADNTHVRLVPQLCGGTEHGSLIDMEIVKDAGGNDDALLLLVECSGEESYILRFRGDSDWGIVKPGMRYTNSYGTYSCNAGGITVLGTDAYLYCQEEHISSLRKIPLTTLLNESESTIQTVLNTAANRFELSAESAPIGTYVSSSTGERSALFAGPLGVTYTPTDPWNPSWYIKPFRLKPGDAAFEAGPPLLKEPSTRWPGANAVKQHGSSMLFGLSLQGEKTSIYRLNYAGSASPAWETAPIVNILHEPYDQAHPTAWRAGGVSKHSMLTSSDGKFYVTRSEGKATVHVLKPDLAGEIATTPELGQWPTFPAMGSTTNLTEHDGSIYLSVPGQDYDSMGTEPNPGFKIYRFGIN